MASVTSLGSGSGLDLESLLTNLMTVEKQPLTAIQTKQSSVNTKISSLGTLKSKLAALQTAAKALVKDIGKTTLEKFATYSANFSTSGIATASFGTGVVAGSYAINVTQLAQGQRFTSTAFTDSSTAIGSVGDTLTFDFATPDAEGNSRTQTITLDSTNNSLAGLRNSINSANMGVTATIVNGTNGAQLLLSGSEGLANEITLSSTTGSLSGLFTETQPVLDAEFTVNGIAAQSSTNAASVIDGITLNLTQTGSTTMTVSADYQTKMTSALNDFITAYNDANTSMRTLGAYNATTKVAGALQGNNVLRDAQAQTRNALFSVTSGGTSSYQRLSDIGVSVGVDGSLSLDATKLSNALTDASGDVASLLSNIGTEFNTSLERFVGTSGTIQIATDSANTILTELTKRSDAILRRLDVVEARYRKQFTALDTLIAGLNSTSSYLTQQIASLTNSNSNN